MARKAPGKTAQTEDRRQLILETALALFTRRGFFNTSVHDIQRAAGVSIGSIYHHFKNKEGLAKALYDDQVERMAVAMEAIMAEHRTAHDRCRAVIAHLFDLTETAPETMQYILYAKHREFLPGEKPVCSSRPFELMKTMVMEGMAGGEIRETEPYVVATAIFGGAIRLIYLRLDGVLPKPLPHYLDAAWECAWRSAVR
ncbi:MAG: TetR/AcrR family transcriptional regulator [Thermodesulfobacteriota bacterium]